jgi:adenylate cyclase
MGRYLRGQWHHAQHTEADNERSRQLFKRAIAIDANFSAPYLGLARCYLEDAVAWSTRSLENAAELSVISARKAIAIDPDDADARAMVAMAAMHSGNADEAHEQVLVARACNPNSPLAILIEAHLLLHAGQPAQARQGLTAYLRIDPRGPHSYLAMHLFAISYYFERDYTKSVEASRRALARNPAVFGTYRWLAAALGQLGRTEEAQAALQKVLELAPRQLEFHTRQRPPWHRPEDYEHMLDGLRKAGWQGG